MRSSPINKTSDLTLSQNPALPDFQEERPPSLAFPFGLLKSSKALRFGCDALLLSAYASKNLERHFHSSKKSPVLVELGCGDGTALLGLLEKWKTALALGLDINANFIGMAVENAARLSESASFRTLDLHQVPHDPTLHEWREKANLVLANPPWRLPSEGHRSSNSMRNMALWAEEDSLAVFTRAASFFLRHGAQYCTIIHPSSLPLLLKELEKNRLGLRELLPLAPRAGQKAMRLLLRAQKNARALPVFLPPLVLHEDASSAFSAAALDFCPWLGKHESPEKTTSPEKT